MERLKAPEQIGHIRKLFIANRGEFAYRAAKICAQRGIAAVVPYTFSDSNPLAAQLVAANLDKGWELAALGGTSEEENYANRKNLLATMQLHGCGAVLLGYGFLSEDPEFIRMCEEAKIKTLTPPSDVMGLTGNKLKAREAAKHIKIGRWSTIPVLEGTEDLKTFEQATINAEKLGYPIMLKDPDLGGGMGNIVVRDVQALENGFTTLKGRPENKQLFMERFIQNAVHVEVQIAADTYGNVVSLGERDCSMQRGSQKVIEESPSPHISDRLRGILQMAAVKFAKAVGYEGVGTWEFLVDLDRRGKKGDPAWYFMEINPRIQVEHPVTEEQIGIDIVNLMFDIAEGKPLPFSQNQIKPQGNTIEARVYAENPDRNFEKSSGTVSVLKYPDLDGVRIDPALAEGDSLSLWYDNTLFKAIAHGPDRETARERLVRLLSETQIVGVSNNLHFLADLLNTSQFREGKATTTFVEDWWRKRLRDRIFSIAEFINGGTFTVYLPSAEYNPNLVPPSSTVVSRKSGEEVTYTDHLDKLKSEKGTTCAARYGIQERDGVRWVLYTLDYSINAGTLGPQEGNLFVDACKLAHEQDLALVTLTSTAGVDNWTNTLGLHQMGRTIAAATAKYPPKFHANVYHGFALGGVPASYAGSAHVQIMVDSEKSKLAFAGIFLFAKGLDIALPENTDAPSVYKILAELDPKDQKYKGLHSPSTQYHDRNVDILVGSLGEASDKITHLIHNLGNPAAVVDRTIVYQPKERIALREGSSETTRVDRPGIHFPVWFSPVSRLRNRLLGRSDESARAEHRFLTNIERWKMIYEVDRPTAADLLDTRFGLFDDTVLLSGPVEHFGEDEIYPSIIAATARIEDLHLLVLAQQTSKVRDEVTGRLTKKYIPQRPADWEYAIRKLEGIGLKNKLPVFYIIDSEGGDSGLESESRGQLIKISDVLKVTFSYPYTSLAKLLGLGGSGGARTFFGTLDGSAAAENSLAFVADPRPKSWIQGGHWLDESSPEFARFINGERTARAEVMMQMGLIDKVIDEGIGGAHKNPRLFTRNIRAWLLSELRRDMLLSIGGRAERRWLRSEAPASLFNTSS